MKLSRAIFTRLVLVFVLITASSRVEAQDTAVGNPVTIRGKIASIKGQELVVTAANGEVRVKAPDTAIIRGEILLKLADIIPGMYLGTTAQKQADGTFRSSEVHIFSEDQRGTGEGHRPSSSVPNSTMTNANVERVEDGAVQDVRGRTMTLKYQGGEVKVFVPPDTPIVKRVPANRESLRPGAEVTIQANRAADGFISAAQITVRASGSSGM